MPFRFRDAKDVAANKTEKKAKHVKDLNSELTETHSRIATNVVHFPRKTNMGKCKRGHAIG